METSTQPVEQRVWPMAQVGEHWASTQAVPAPHETPQPPQFAGSLPTSTHASPHSAFGGTHGGELPICRSVPWLHAETAANDRHENKKPTVFDESIADPP